MVYSKLKGIMKENAYSQGKLAKELNITTQSLNAKLNGRSQFTIKEAINIISIFNIKIQMIYLKFLQIISQICNEI